MSGVFCFTNNVILPSSAGQTPICGINVTYNTRAYPKVSGLSRNEIYAYDNKHSKINTKVTAAKLSRLSHKIAMQLHLLAESGTICSFRSRRPVRKLVVTSSYTGWNLVVWQWFFKPVQASKNFLLKQVCKYKEVRSKFKVNKSRHIPGSLHYPSVITNIRNTIRKVAMGWTRKNFGRGDFLDSATTYLNE